TSRRPHGRDYAGTVHFESTGNGSCQNAVQCSESHSPKPAGANFCATGRASRIRIGWWALLAIERSSSAALIGNTKETDERENLPCQDRVYQATWSVLLWRRSFILTTAGGRGQSATSIYIFRSTYARSIEKSSAKIRIRRPE